MKMDFESFNKESEYVGMFDFKNAYYTIVKFKGLYYSVDISNVGIIGLNSEGHENLQDLHDILVNREER